MVFRTLRVVHEKGLEPSRLSAPEPKDVGHAANGCERKHFEALQKSVECGCRPLARGAGHSPAFQGDRGSCFLHVGATSNRSHERLRTARLPAALARDLAKAWATEICRIV
jgi:hypothetical protein